MIGYLKGSVLELHNRTCLLNIQGVGYEVLVPDRIMGAIGDELELYVYTHVREDIFQLYGFSNREEKKFFELLLSVNGIGPKSGLEIMSHAPSVIISALLSEDIAALTRIPGIGKKTAERMLIDLRGKLDQFMGLADTSVQEHTNVRTPGTGQLEYQCRDVIQALEALGYDKRTILPVLQSMNDGVGPMKDENEEGIIKYCLQRL